MPQSASRIRAFLQGLQQRVHQLPGALSSLLAVAGILALGLTVAALWIADPIAIRQLRLAQFDQLQRWFPRPYTPAAVRIVDIDEQSLKAFGQWPWPRTRVAQLVQALRDDGAAVVAFDVLLSEPDRTSPAALAAQWQNAALRRELQGLPDNDTLLAQTFADIPVVLGMSLEGSNSATQAGLATALEHPPYRVVQTGTEAAARAGNRGLDAYFSAVLPLPGLQAAASAVGALNYAPDADGVVRRLPLLFTLGEQVVPSLAAEVFRLTQNSRNYQIHRAEAGIDAVRIGQVSVPTDPQGALWLAYTPSQPMRFLSAQKVLSRQVDRKLLAGHVVLIGSSAAGLLDLRFNPMGELMPGVTAHALALEQMLSGSFVQRPSWIAGLEGLLLLLGVLFAGLLSLSVSAPMALLALPVAMGGLLGASVYAYKVEHVLLDTSLATLASVLAFVVGSTIHHLVSEREQRWVRAAFSRYVSPNRVEYLIAHHNQLQLGGQRQTCSFVFTDLAGFTALMEHMDPASAVALLNDYLDGMLAVAFAHEGTLDRIVGDAVVVLFSAPVPQPDHCQRALRCALALDHFAYAYAQRIRQTGVPWGMTRIGVHTGEVIVGNFGGKTLFDYRALGDPVNTAARLEGANKHLGTRICVSGQVMQHCPDVPARYVGRLLLAGKTQPLAVYEPEAVALTARYAPAADYAGLMAQLQPQSAATGIDMPAWRRCAQAHPQDPLLALHLQRLQAGATDDLIVLGDK